MVAKAGLLELQTTEFVSVRVLPSLKVPVAVYCLLLPTPTNRTPAGVTEMEVSATGMTVSTADPLIEPSAAEMVVCPGAAVAARPVPLMLATAMVDELQLAVVVRSRCEPSL